MWNKDFYFFHIKKTFNFLYVINLMQWSYMVFLLGKAICKRKQLPKPIGFENCGYNIADMFPLKTSGGSNWIL